MTDTDPLATVKLLLSTYGIPPELVQGVVDGALDLVDGRRQQVEAGISWKIADETRILLEAAKTASSLGETALAKTLIGLAAANVTGEAPPET